MKMFQKNSEHSLYIHRFGLQSSSDLSCTNKSQPLADVAFVESMVWMRVVVLVLQLSSFNLFDCLCMSSGSKNDICGFSSTLRCIMALEYSRLSNIFSHSCIFNECSVFACKPNDFVLPKLSLHMKHMSIGLEILVPLFALGSLVSVGVLLLLVRLMHCASRALTTRNEWIFGLLVGAAFWAPPLNIIRYIAFELEEDHHHLHLIIQLTRCD